MLNLIYLALFGLVSFFRVNRSKPMPWMVANIVWLVGMGALSWFHQNVYFGVGAAVAVATVGVSLFVKKLPLTGNVGTYVKMVFSNLLFFPVEAFEAAYAYLSPKL